MGYNATMPPLCFAYLPESHLNKSPLTLHADRAVGGIKHHAQRSKSLLDVPPRTLLSQRTPAANHRDTNPKKEPHEATALQTYEETRLRAKPNNQMHKTNTLHSPVFPEENLPNATTKREKKTTAVTFPLLLHYGCPP